MRFDEQGGMLTFGEFPQLQTERLILRRMTLDDLGFYFRHFSDPDIARLTAFEPPRDLKAAEEELRMFCIDNFQQGTGIRWGIEGKGEHKLIGTCGYHQWAKGDFRARIGYDLGAPYRRQGLMTEALRAMIRYGFEAMRLNRIEVLTSPQNIASIRLLRKLGFTREGVLREYTHFRGSFEDDSCLALLRSEWSRQEAPPAKPLNNAAR